MNSIHSFNEYLSNIFYMVAAAFNTGDKAASQTDKTAAFVGFL